MSNIRQFRFFDLDLGIEPYNNIYLNEYGEACEMDRYGEMEIVEERVISDEFTGFFLDGEQLFTSDILQTAIETEEGDTVYVFGIVYYEPEIDSLAVELPASDPEEREFVDLVSYMETFGEESEIFGNLYENLSKEELEEIRESRREFLESEDNGGEVEW